MRKFALIFASRNNYELYEKIFFLKSMPSMDDILVFNVDCGSSKEQKEYGKKICELHNIINLEVESKNNKWPYVLIVEEVIKYLDKNNIDINWLMVSQHDLWFEQEDDFDKIDILLNKKEINERVGTIGFGVRGICDLKDLNKVVYGRGNLIEGMIEKRGYFQDISKQYLLQDYFLTEVCYWGPILINKNLFKKYIIPDYDFILNLWADDIAHQFLKNNCANIVMPKIIVKDDHLYKNLIGFPSCNSSYDKKYFGDHWNHHKFWNEKYGYHMFYDLDGKTLEEKENKRKEIFNFVKDNFKNTLINEIYTWNVNDNFRTLEDINNFQPR